MRRLALALLMLAGCASHVRYPYEKTVELGVSGGLPQAVTVTFPGAVPTPNPIASVPAPEPREVPSTWHTELVPAVSVLPPDYVLPVADHADGKTVAVAICWVNPDTAKKFHRDRHCRFVSKDAYPEACVDAEKHRKPCRTCGGGTD